MTRLGSVTRKYWNVSPSTFCTGLLCSNILQPKPCLPLSGSIEVQACRVSRVFLVSLHSVASEVQPVMDRVHAIRLDTGSIQVAYR